MNWDRWQDASWVRWHKLLPEKQGGWAFQALIAANVPPTVVLGSPALLLHLNSSLVPTAWGLLLHMDGANGSSVFVDSSVNALPITNTGTAIQSTSIFEFGPASGSFTNGLISAPLVPGGPLDLQQDFTVQGWFNATTVSRQQIIWSTLTTTGDATYIRMYINGGQLVMQNASNTGGPNGQNPDSTTAIVANTWYHFACVRHGADLYLFVNGQLAGSDAHVASGTTLAQGPLGANFNVGGDAFAVVQGIFFTGSLDEISVLNGVALWTANFTPPAAPFTQLVPVLLPSYADSSVFNFPVTPIGLALGETSTVKFGNGAVSMPAAPATGTLVNALTTPITAGSALDILSGSLDFTVEGFFFLTAGTTSDVFLVDYGDPPASTGGNGFYLHVNQAAGMFIAASGVSGWGSAGASSGVTISLGAWHHFAVVRTSGVPSLYLDGVLVGTTTGTWRAYTGVPVGSQISFGGSTITGTNNSTAGIFMDEVRVTGGIALYTTAFTPPLAENTLGLPNALGTANPPNAIVPTTYLGIARAVHDWSSIDGQYWIAIGTHLKLYVVNQGTLYDITPQRKTSNVVNALTTSAGSNVVTVTDVGHQASTDDFIDLIGAAPVGGINIAGSYQLSVIDPNTYTIVASQSAISGVSGGGSFSIGYEIGSGLPANGQLLGYGTGPYGIGTYGTARPIGTGVFARMRTWSLDNYGQDLIASESDGEIYLWARDSGPNSRAQIIANAPEGCQRVLVDSSEQVIVALGCTDVTSAFNACLVRWCSFGDITDWFPTDVNTAGDDFLTSGSSIVTALKTKGQNLIWTDTTLYRMVFVGAPDIYDFIPAGEVDIVGPNAAVDVDGIAYFMGFDNIYNYSGTLMLTALDTWETVFDATLPTSLNRAQAESVVCFTYEPKTEITWLYQSIGGAFTVTFTTNLNQGATSATLSTPWTGATGLYDLQFSDQEAQVVELTNGSTAASWGLPLTAGVGPAAIFIGNDRYVTLNWEDATAYCGAWNRTCAAGRAAAMAGFPYGVNAGYLYQHEVGTDAIEASGTVPIGFFMKSLDITIGGAKSEYTMGGSDARFAVGGSDAHLLIRSMLPDWKYLTGTMNLTLLSKDRPQEANYVKAGPVAFTAATPQIDIDAHGSQVVIQMDNFTGAGGAPSLGSSFRMGIFQGLAVPYAKR
jgi:Concanavalin A-like lectin/glucanases superfamily